MRVRRLTLPELSGLVADWDRLAGGVPFRGSDWLLAWWRHYGEAGADRLCVLGCWEDGASGAGGALVGLWPLYGRRGPLGTVLRPLGGGEVCSDYLGILCAAGHEEAVGRALAAYLSQTQSQARANPGADAPPRWDLLELEAQDAADGALAAVLRSLSGRGHLLSARPGPRWWRIELPADYAGYLQQVSRSHRTQLRRAERRATELGIELEAARDEAGRARAFHVLAELHARRRRQLGDAGAFASARFRAFHDEVSGRLMRRGAAWLSTLSRDGRALAAMYALVGDGVFYAYQSGLDPDALDLEPGRLMLIRLVQEAIGRGASAVDLLRGDQPYKAHFRAVPRDSRDVLVAHRHLGARLRFHLWTGGQRARAQVRGLLGRAQPGGDRAD